MSHEIDASAKTIPLRVLDPIDLRDATASRATPAKRWWHTPRSTP